VNNFPTAAGLASSAAGYAALGKMLAQPPSGMAAGSALFLYSAGRGMDLVAALAHLFGLAVETLTDVAR
jgi:hypothetical protein